MSLKYQTHHTHRVQLGNTALYLNIGNNEDTLKTS